MIHRSRYPIPELPDRSLPGYVLEDAAARGDHPALVDGQTGERLSYGALVDAVSAAMLRLRERGIERGAVGLLASNQPRWAAALYGITAVGAAAVPLNPALTAGEIVKLLRLADVSLLVSDRGSAPKATEVAALTGVPVLALDELVAAPVPPPPVGLDGLWSVIGAGQPEPGGSRPAVIAFSSGTTGQPKGVVLTHRNLVAAICQHEAVYHVGQDDRFLAALPFFHIYGLSMILDYGLRHGATLFTLPRFDLQRYLVLAERERVTWLHVVPPMVLHLLSPAAEGADLSAVRHLVSGAAPLDAGLAARVRDRIGVAIGQGYGMTEASPGVTWVPDDGSVDCPPGSVGVLVAGTEARLVDPATGVDTEGPGELWVRGPQIMAGYLGDDVATAATVVEDGWLRTGDIARVDADGVWWIVDRLKELIKYNGFQVAPAELEALLLGHPRVADAAVVGLPDPAAGEIPQAWIVADGPLDATELMAWVAERVAPYKRIRAVSFVDSLPRSPSGKILRRQLRSAGSGA